MKRKQIHNYFLIESLFMTDVVSPKIRSSMMSGIRSKNTKVEILIRKALHQKGFRYRIHVKSLPSKPDIVFNKYKAVIQINGCFWHGHNCSLFKRPSSHIEFWNKKIDRNKLRDSENLIELEKLGWRVLTIWECTTKGKFKLPFLDLIEQISIWLTTYQNSTEITQKHY